MPLAFAHTGHEHTQSWLDALLSWSFDPTFLIPLVVALLYLRGLYGYRREGGTRFPWWRAALPVLGVTIAAVGLLGPIRPLAKLSFTWHMVQHMLLMQVTVPLVMIGNPFIPVVRGLPGGMRRHGFIPAARWRIVRRALGYATRPLVGFAGFQGAIVLWHLPILYNAALRSDGVHYVQHVMFVLGAIFFWWNVITPYPFPSAMGPLLRIAYLFGASLVNSAVSAPITFADKPLYLYGELPGFEGMTMAQDQVLGGALMWVMGGMLYLGVILAVFIVYAIEEERREPVRAVLPQA